MIKFIRAYIEHGNGTRAYKEAGYSAKTDTIAAAEASKLLQKPKVSEEISRIRKELTKKEEVSTEKIVKELCGIAFGSMAEAIAIENGKLLVKDDAELKFMDSVSNSESHGDNSYSRAFSFKRSDKVKAMDMLCKILGLYDKQDNEQRRNLEANASRVLDAIRKFKK